MNGKNKVILIGNVGKDPEIISLESGSKLAKFSLATSKTYKKKDGESNTDTQWHSIVAFDKLAEIIEKYVHQGNRLYLEGEIRYRKHEEKWYTSIHIHDMLMLSKKEDEPVKEASSKAADEKAEQEFIEDKNDDLPF